MAPHFDEDVREGKTIVPKGNRGLAPFQNLWIDQPYLLSKMSETDCPIPVGVFRAVRQPTLHELMEEQIIKARQAAPTDLQAVLNNSEESA